MSAIADHYRRLAHNFSETVAAVPPDRWGNQSPCEEWSARDVVNHVVDSEIGVTTAPVVGSGSCPAWRARVEKPRVWSVMRPSVCRALRTRGRGQDRRRCHSRSIAVVR